MPRRWSSNTPATSSGARRSLVCCAGSSPGLTSRPRRRHDLVRMSHDPEGATAARTALLAAFADAHASGERVVVHCRGGQSRTGLALATWLVGHHGLSAAQAAEEVLRGATAAGVVRFASADKVAKFTGAA